MKWIIILLAFIGSWEQMKAQQNPIILNEKNVTDLTTAADWDKLIDTWNYVPLENSDNSRLGSIETCYIYGDYLFIKDYHDGEMRMMQFKLTGDFMHRVGKYGSGEQEHGALGLPWVDLEKRQITLHDGFSSHKKVTYDLAGTQTLLHGSAKDMPAVLLEKLLLTLRELERDMLLSLVL